MRSALASMRPRFAADYRTFLWVFLAGALVAFEYARPEFAPWLFWVNAYFALALGTVAHNHNHCPTFADKRANQLFAIVIDALNLRGRKRGTPGRGAVNEGRHERCRRDVSVLRRQQPGSDDLGQVRLQAAHRISLEERVRDARLLQRATLALKLTNLAIVEGAPGFSFPSGHVLGTFLLVGAAWFVLMQMTTNALQRRLLTAGAAAVLLVMGMQRVYAGAHWTSDVIGGYVWGWLLLFPLVQLYWLIQRRQPVYSAALDHGSKARI